MAFKLRLNGWKWWFDISMLLVLIVVFKYLVLPADLFTRYLFGFLFSLPLIAVLYRIIQMAKGKDMSTQAALNEINEVLDSEKQRFAQGPESVQFRKVLEIRIYKAIEMGNIDVLLNDIHDAVLMAKNRPEGLLAAINHLKSE